MFKGHYLKVIGLLGLSLLIGGSLLAGCRKSTVQSAKSHKLTVVTTTNFYGDLARAVGGKRIHVTSIINRPSVDPHDFEPTSQVAATVAKADIIVANGLGYDSWLPKLAKNAPQAQMIQVGEDVMGKQTGANAHLWYDPQTMPKLATYLATQLGKQQPQSRAYFKANAKKYVASLKPIQTELTALKKKAQTSKTKQVFVSEPVFDYALTAMGFKVGNANFEKAVEKGTDPSPKVIKTMQSGLKHQRVAFFVQNKQVSDALVANMVNLAKHQHVPVLQVTETMPAKQNYRQWMLSQYRTLGRILD